MKSRIFVFLAVIVTFGTNCAAAPIPQRSSATVNPGIRFEYAKGELDQLCTKLIVESKKKYNELKNIPKKDRNFQTTFLAFENITADFTDAITPMTFMGYVSPNEVTHAEGSKCEEAYGIFNATLVTDHDLYVVLKDGVPPTGNTVNDRLAYWTLLAFEKNGMALPADQLARVSKSLQELASLQTMYSDNLNKDKSLVTLTKEELKGLPKDFIQGLTANTEGLYEIKTKRDAYDTVMENASNPDARKKMLTSWNNRAGTENTKLLQSALILRQKIAALLGFKTWADFQIKGRMATDSKTVLEFLGSLRIKLEPKNKEILAKLLTAKKKEIPGATLIDAWDPLYYINQIKKTQFSVDTDAISEYLPAHTVMKGVFEIYSTLFNVRFEEVKGAPVWHDGVTLYKIIDASKNTVRAYFYTDSYPRAGKYGHFAAFPLISGRKLPSGNYSLPIAGMVGNFPEPKNGKPSLLTHDMAETVFHEFGHIMHQTLTTVPYASLSGSSVLQDFVEAPSQMLENWVWNARILKRISGHYLKPSKKLPKQMIEKLIGAKTFDAGYAYTRQLLLGLFDMEIHMQTGDVNVSETFNRMFREIQLIEPLLNQQYPASFGHLMGGYDAGYYGYLWSKVYAEDMFSKFEKEGLMNPTVGMQYLDQVISRGNSKEPMDLLTAFLNRKPTMDAFYKSLGL